MRNLLYICFGIGLLLVACKKKETSQTNQGQQAHPELAAITNAVHGFYTWYEGFSTNPGETFVDMKGAYARLDTARFRQYTDQLLAGGKVSEGLVADLQTYYRLYSPIWEFEDKDEILTGRDYDLFTCSQDLMPDYLKSGPIKVESLGDTRVSVAFPDSTGTQGPKLELIKENGAWVVDRLDCGIPLIDDFSGLYQSTEPSCAMEITIALKDGHYLYTAKTGKRTQSGKVKVSFGENETYLTFLGLGGSGKNSVEGLYASKEITIQNSGNAMNQFTHFKDCDAKYIRLTKTAARADVPTPVEPKPVKPAPIAKKPVAKSGVPTVAVNRNGEIMLSGKKIAPETLRKELQAALLKLTVIPDEIRSQSIGEVGMGTRQETQTVVNESVAGAKWIRKKAAIATLNSAVSKKLGLPTEIGINRYATNGAFAFIDAHPEMANGPIDYRRTPYAKALQSGTFVERVYGLLKFENGAWKLLDYTIGTAQSPSKTWIKKYKAPKALF